MANDLNIRGMVIKTVVALILLFGAVILLGLLAREPIDVAMATAHPLAERTELTPDDVVDWPWVGVPQLLAVVAASMSAQAERGRDR